MPDMLVKLYKVKEDPALEARLAANGIQLKRALAPDIQRITGFVRENFGDGWANECLAGILRDGCWIAVKDKKSGRLCLLRSHAPQLFWADRRARIHARHGQSARHCFCAACFPCASAVTPTPSSAGQAPQRFMKKPWTPYPSQARKANPMGTWCSDERICVWRQSVN